MKHHLYTFVRVVWNLLHSFHHHTPTHRGKTNSTAIIHYKAIIRSILQDAKTSKLRLKPWPRPWPSIYNSEMSHGHKPSEYANYPSLLCLLIIEAASVNHLAVCVLTGHNTWLLSILGHLNKWAHKLCPKHNSKHFCPQLLSRLK